MNKNLILKLAVLLTILSLILVVISWDYYNVKHRFANSSQAAKYLFFLSIRDSYNNALNVIQDLKKNNNNLVFNNNMLYLFDSLNQSESFLEVLYNINPKYRKYESKVSSLLFTIRSVKSLVYDISSHLSNGTPITRLVDNKLIYLTNEDICNILSKYCSLVKNIISENGKIAESDKVLDKPDKYFDEMLEKWNIKKAELLFHNELKDVDITTFP